MKILLYIGMLAFSLAIFILARHSVENTFLRWTLYIVSVGAVSPIFDRIVKEMQHRRGPPV